MRGDGFIGLRGGPGLSMEERDVIIAEDFCGGIFVAGVLTYRLRCSLPIGPSVLVIIWFLM